MSMVTLSGVSATIEIVELFGLQKQKYIMFDLFLFSPTSLTLNVQSHMMVLL